MASIRTAIELQDNFTSVLNQIVNSVNLGLSAMENLQQAMNTPVDSDTFEAARDQINQATIAVQELEAAMQGMNAPEIDSPIAPENAAPVQLPIEPQIPDPLVDAPDPVQVPVEWQSDNLEVFTNTGVERFQSEVQSANEMLNTLNETQSKISSTAAGTNILPPTAVADLNNLQTRIAAIQNRIQTISNNPLNMGTDEANAELETLRGQLNQAIQAQNNLNEAVENMDVEAANQAYLNLSSTISGTERYIRDNVDEQGRFNSEVKAGTEGMNNLEGAVQKVVAAIGGMFAISKVVGFINDCTEAANVQNNAESQLAATLANMGGTEKDYDALVAKAQSIQEAGMYGDEALIGAAAEFATYMNDTTAIEMMMDTLTNYAAGMSGGGGIDYESMVQYATNLGKITTGAYDAMTKKGFEFTDAQKAVIDGTATQAQYVEALGEDWETMSEDMRSATVIADIINESWSGLYDTMSQTPEAQLQSLKNSFGDIQEMVGNRLYVALGTLYSTISANMPTIESAIMLVANALSQIIEIISYIINLAVEVGSVISENWSIIEPIVLGIVGVLGVYAAYLGIVKGIELASAAAKGALAVAEGIHAVAIWATTSATWAETTAQLGLNGALYACPIVWIIGLIIALIAIIFAVCSAIAKFTGIANSGFGVITGGINVAIQFFKNLGLTVANIALGIGNALAAVASNMMTAFHNAICSVQAWFYGLLSDVLTVIEGICAALNKLPFVDIDYSGITAAADNYAAKQAEAEGNKQEYKSISEAFNEGMSTFDTFQEGWASDAFEAGAAWGDGVADNISSALDGFFESPEMADSYSTPVADIFENSSMAGNLDDIAADTGGIKDSISATQEDLKYLRDIAEQDAINRYTTAEIHVDMSGMSNNINNGMDLDGVVSGLTDAVNEAIDTMTEGVHE